MFGRPEWFTYRTFGWGIKAKTWQGWVYLGVFVALIVGPNFLPIGPSLKSMITKVVLALGLIDVITIWVLLDKFHDEREQLHQLIIERNCSLAAVSSLCAIMAYRCCQNQVMPATGMFQLNTGRFPFDPLLIVMALVMALTKLASTIYLWYRK
ncbi:MAG TPA: hypothetical protein VK914_05710 [bacterium]|jgi:hypothetical protein|nr:hypothetical protein [bacterium]